MSDLASLIKSFESCGFSNEEAKVEAKAELERAERERERAERERERAERERERERAYNLELEKIKLEQIKQSRNELNGSSAGANRGNAGQENAGLQLQPPQNSLAYVGQFWTFTPHSGPLRHSNYSPMSYSPSTKASLQESSEDTSYYYDLITSALKWITYYEAPHNKYHSKLTGGVFTVSKGLIVVVTVREVTTALQLSNIYHMLKALQGDLSEWTRFLRKNGVPTLIQAIHTGNTPPVDATHYELDGLELLCASYLEL